MPSTYSDGRVYQSPKAAANIPANCLDIFDRAHAGDREAEARLFDIFSYLVEQLIDPTSDDQRLAANLALLNGIRKFRADRGFQLQTYFATCIRNALFKLNQRSKARPEQSGVEDWDGISIDETLPDEEQLCERIILGQILESLDERDREIMVLLSEGYRVTEISRTVKLSRSYVHCLINRIRESVGADCLDEWSLDELGDNDQDDARVA